MSRRLIWVGGLVLAVGLAGCSDKPQVNGQRKVGQPSSAGTGTPFQAPGWKAGDATSWNDHLRARAQYGQNDYSRTGGK